MERTDYEIVQLAKTGDQTAFYHLYSASRDLAYTTAKLAAATEPEQVSILVSAYTDGFRRLDTFGPSDRFEAWMAAIVMEQLKMNGMPPPAAETMPGAMARDLYQEILLGAGGSGKAKKKKPKREKREVSGKLIALFIALSLAVGVGVPILVRQVQRAQQQRELDRLAASASRSLAELDEQRRQEDQAYEQIAGELASEREAALAQRDAPAPENGEESGGQD